MRMGAKHPPALSIANGNYVGHIPAEFELNRSNKQIVALVSPCMSISTVTGGPCRTIKAHHYVVKNTEGPIVAMFPKDIADRVHVALIGNIKSGTSCCLQQAIRC